MWHWCLTPLANVLIYLGTRPEDGREGRWEGRGAGYGDGGGREGGGGDGEGKDCQRGFHFLLFFCRGIILNSVARLCCMVIR